MCLRGFRSSRARGGYAPARLDLVEVNEAGVVGTDLPHPDGGPGQLGGLADQAGVAESELQLGREETALLKGALHPNHDRGRGLNQRSSVGSGDLGVDRSDGVRVIRSRARGLPVVARAAAAAAEGDGAARGAAELLELGLELLGGETSADVPSGELAIGEVSSGHQEDSSRKRIAASA